MYVAFIVVLASIIGRGRPLAGRGAPRRVAKVPARTVGRWLDWWTIVFALTAFWQEAQGFFATPVNEATLPGSLLDRLDGVKEPALIQLLRLIAPITTTSVRAPIAMPV